MRPAESRQPPADDQRPDPVAGRTRNEARRRLGDLLRARPSAVHVLVGVLLALVGFAATVQIQVTRGDDTFATARREDLVRILEGLALSATRLEAEIGQREEELARLRMSADRTRVALAQARAQAEVLGILAGTLPAFGPGISVRITGSQVGASTLLNALQELRDAGAEAIEINDRVRVAASTDLIDAPGGIKVDGHLLRPPYRVEAIGDPRTLSTALQFRGGLVDEVRALGGDAAITREGRVEVDSLHRPETPGYSRPASAEPGG